MELWNRTDLNISHGRINRLATGLQQCDSEETAACRIKLPRSKNHVNYIEDYIDLKRGLTTQAQVWQPYFIIVLILFL